MPDNQYILEVENLTKYFATPAGQLHAVDGVSFKIEKGKTLGIVGESGCGKSTTGRTLLKLIEPTSGKLIFDGEDITSYSPARMRKMRTNMQMIFQDPFSSLDPRQSVMQLISEPMIQHKLVKGKAAIEKRTLELMETVGLAQRYVNSYPHELDGGRRQRVGIGRALALNPKFIVCDEPVSALDVSIQAQVLNLLMDLQDQRQLTYMFVTHDLSVVRHISDNICVMYLGQLVETCSSKKLFAKPLHPYTKALLSAIPSTDVDRRMQRVQLKGEITSPINPKPGCRFAARCPFATAACKEPQQLREIELDHFVQCCRIEELY